MKGIQIISTGRALPHTELSNDDMSKIVDTSDEWISGRTGIKNRFKCVEESCTELAVSAAKQALEKTDIDVNEIGAVIVATSTSDYIFPSSACIVHERLGLPKECMALDISAACTGFLYALKLAHGFINTSKKKYVMIVGSEQMSRILDYTDRTTCILFGDGAGAAIVEGTQDAYFQKSWVKGNIEALNCPGVGNANAYIHMKGNEVFKFAVTVMEQGINDILAEAGCTLEDIDYVICHQANSRIIDHVKKKYKGYEDKFIVNIKNYGNTSAASIPIAIDEVMADKSEKKAVKLLCVGFGAGLTWSAAIINYRNGD